MRKFIVLLVALVAAVIVGIKVAQDPGYALFVYRQWSVEMPLWLSLALALMVLFIFYIVIRSVDSLKLYGNYVRVWNRQRKRNYAHHMLCDGLIELIEGRWHVAEKKLLTKVKRSGTPLVNYLMAAQAAQAQQNYTKRDAYLRLAHGTNPSAKIAIGLTKAKLQHEQGQLEQALATLEHLRQIAPKHKYILQMLCEINLALKDWGRLKQLLPLLRQAKILDTEQLFAIELTVYTNLLFDITNIEQLEHFWQATPKVLRKNSTVLVSYVKKLIAFGDLVSAEKTISYSLNHHEWCDDLISLYAELSVDLNKQLKTAEHWHKQHPQSAALNFALARFAEQLTINGQAGSYYEASLQIKPDPKVYKYYIVFLQQHQQIDKALALSAKALQVLT